MLIRQIIISLPKWSYMIGIIRDDSFDDYLESKVGNYGYHPYDLDNTTRHYGKFKLELLT